MHMGFHDGDASQREAGARGAVKGRATMRDVAKRAGVSLKTVSRVVNEEPGVSAATIAIVTAAMDELSFQRDLLAGSLRRQDRRSDSIGLIVAGVDNPFDAIIHRAAEDAAAANHVAVFAASTNEEIERERSLVRAFTSRRVDGLIIMPCGRDQSYLEPELTAGTPIIMVDRPPVGVAADCVISDHQNAAKLAVEHLLAAGHTRIAFLGDLSHIASLQARKDGYLEAMQAAGVTVDPELMAIDNHSENAALGTALRMISSAHPPTAIFSAQNRVTQGVVRALYERNVHKKIALVSFDDFPLADMLNPAVTVVAQDPYTIGRLAAERVFERLENPKLPVKTITVPARLVRRGSGEIPPPADE
jgi:LacI family transcriptional regulator